MFFVPVRAHVAPGRRKKQRYETNCDGLKGMGWDEMRPDEIIFDEMRLD